MKTLTKNMQANSNPARALTLPNTVNQRFFDKRKIKGNLQQSPDETSGIQHTSMAVLGSRNSEFVQIVSEINIRRTVKILVERSPIFKKTIKADDCGISYNKMRAL